MEAPFERFQRMLAEAQAFPRDLIPEPTAFASTDDADGQPSVRMLLLKDVDQGGFVFYTNLDSRKARELEANPRAAMNFHWPQMESAVRVEGAVTPVTGAEADEYFASRARGSQVGAWASRQSHAIEQAGDLDKRVADVERRFAGRDVPRPAHWSGFRLRPSVIEFWKGRPSRLHERQRFVRDGEGWRVELLYP